MSASSKQTDTASPLAALLRAKAQRGERVYGVVDAARALELVEAAKDRSDKTRWHGSLMNGPLAKFLQHVSPHLVEIDLESDYTAEWRRWIGRSAGVLLISSAAPEALLSHLRALFVVRDESNAEYSFRYYDPRVLRMFLPTCDEGQLREFFGPIRLVAAEAGADGALLFYENGGRAVSVATAVLAAGGA